MVRPILAAALAGALAAGPTRAEGPSTALLEQAREDAARTLTRLAPAPLPADLPRPAPQADMARAAHAAAAATPAPEQARRARDLLDLTAGADWQARLAQARALAAGTLGLAPGSSGDTLAAASAGRRLRLYLFVSSSLPEALLRRYAADLEGLPADVSMVLRGFVGGAARVGPTVELAARVLRRDAGCGRADCPLRQVDLLVDPLLFRRFGVTRVPALAYAARFERIGTCSEGTDDGARNQGQSVVYGDAALAHLLRRLAAASGEDGLSDLAGHLERGAPGEVPP